MLPARFRRNDHVEHVHIFGLVFAKALLQTTAKNSNADAAKQPVRSKQSVVRKWGEIAPEKLSLRLGIVMCV